MPHTQKLRKDLGISCVNCGVKDLCIVRDLEQEDVAWLDEHIQYIKTYQPGDYIYEADAKIDKIFAVYSGICKDFSVSKMGDVAINEFYLPGDLMGLECLSRGSYQFNAVAIKETQVCIIPAELMRSADLPIKIRNQFFNILCAQIENQHSYKTNTDSRRRTAAFFYNLIRRSNMRPEEEIMLDMTHLDISNKIGIANETLSRILKEFNAADIIKIVGRQIVKSDSDLLEKIINM